MSNSFFNGNERLEMFNPLGKLMRMGSPNDLLKSDSKIFEELIRNKNWDEAKKYLDNFKASADGMVALSTQWCLNCTYVLDDLVSNTPEILKNGFMQFQKNTKNIRSEAIGENVANHFDSIIDPEILVIDKVKEIQTQIASEQFDWIGNFFKFSQDYYEKLSIEIENKNESLTLDTFKNYRKAALYLHDLIFEYVSAIADETGNMHGDEIGKSLIQKSFGEMPAVVGLWSVIKDWAPDELAAWLAEHLRDHFSGKDRDGAVRIEEDNEKYVLHFEPCGSGGAIRSRHDKENTSPYLFKKACPQTWGRENEVPAYCSHCAVNELSSMKVAGYPLWITNFTADPNESCGWTIYKNKENIPAEFYERLGYKKP